MYQNVYKYDEMKRRQQLSVRNTAGWHYFTHQLVEVYGPDAAAVLDRMYTAPISGMKNGKNKYCLMLNEQGRIIDDVIVIRQAEDRFWISNLNLFLLLKILGAEAEGGARIQFSPITAQYDMYSVQGPASVELVNAMVEKPIDSLRFFTMEDNCIDELPVKINRAGFTGEKFGYEIYAAPADAAVIAGELRSVGPLFQAEEVTDLQLFCWSIPTEKGLLLMRDMLDLTPMDVGLERYVDWGKDFVGKEALLPMKDREPEWELLGFTLDQDDAFIPSGHYGGPGCRVCLDGEKIGRVSKFVYSFTLEKNIGYVLVEKGRVEKGCHVSLCHNENYDAVITDRIFF